MEFLKCPVCQGNLHKIDNTFKCEKNHSYDISSKGYTNMFTARICDTFKLHPILGAYKNKITVLGVRAGRMEKVWKEYIRFHLRNSSRIDDRIIFVVHGGCTVRQQEMIMQEINRCVKFKQVIFTQVSSSSVCNAGLSSIGFAIYQK